MSSTKQIFPFFFVFLVGLFFAAAACGDNSTASQAPHQVQGDQNRPSLSTLVQRFDPKRGHWTDVTIAELEPKDEFLLEDRLHKVHADGVVYELPEITADAVAESHRSPGNDVWRLPGARDVAWVLKRDAGAHPAGHHLVGDLKAGTRFRQAPSRAANNLGMRCARSFL